jgi:uncharacterized protein (TIGR02118 family)
LDKIVGRSDKNPVDASQEGARDGEDGMLLVTAVYEARSGSRFDFDDYTGRHLRLAKGLLEPYGLLGVRVARGIAAMDGGPPPYCAVAEMHFQDADGFQRGMAAHGAELLGDADRYTDIEPVLQISELLND